MMRLCLITLLLVPSLSFGGEYGEFLEEPNAVGRIAAALALSGVEELKARVIDEAGSKCSYHLKSIDVLGSLERGGQKFVLAAVFFVRSSPKGRVTPPARGHSFLVCLSPDFRLSGHCRLSSRDVTLSGAALMRSGRVIADFSADDEGTRRRGFSVEGGKHLPYPFSERPPSAAPQGKR